MKENTFSLKFTIGVVKAISIIFIALIFSFWKLAELYCKFAYVSFNHDNYLALVITFYICSPMAALVLFNLHKFLKNVQKGSIFTTENTKILRLLSYLCFAAVPASIPLCFFFAGAFPIPCSAGFMALILRVLKNVFAEGCIIKDENDLTV